MIIAVYNVNKFLHRAFDSLKCQTIGFENLEVIFADDCSTDGSWEIVLGLAQLYPNVTALQLPRNSGACGAPRNAALELATANYFMCFDPDDELPVDACKVLYDAIENSGADFAFGYHQDVDTDGIVLNEKAKRYDDFEEKVYDFPESLPLFIPRGTIHLAKIYRTAIYREANISFPIKIPGQDMVFTVHYLFESKKAVYINKPVYSYSVHPNSISFSSSKKFFLEINQIFQHCYELFRNYNYQAEYKTYIDDALSFYLYRMLDSSLESKEVEEIFEAWAWLWEYYAITCISYCSTFAEIMGAVFFSNKRMIVYNNLRVIRRYEMELVNAKTWFLDQMDSKDKEIAHRDREIESRDKEIAHRDNEIAYRDGEIAYRDGEIAYRDMLLNYGLVKIALKLEKALRKIFHSGKQALNSRKRKSNR
jgi:glycosyltransferase involved in cell wall biosynthesis